MQHKTNLLDSFIYWLEANDDEFSKNRLNVQLPAGSNVNIGVMSYQ